MMANDGPRPAEVVQPLGAVPVWLLPSSGGLLEARYGAGGLDKNEST